MQLLATYLQKNALAPDGKDNGLLTSNEILDLKLNTELIVLSACDTGRGKMTGDSAIGEKERTSKLQNTIAIVGIGLGAAQIGSGYK